MKLFLSVLGLVMVIEGLPYFAFPEKMKDFLKQLEEMPAERLRLIGLASTLAGLLLCYLTQRSGLFQ